MAKHPTIALIAYLREELPADERVRVMRHLEGCATCRDLKDSLARVTADLARLLDQMPAPDPLIYRAQLALKLAARPAERGWWRPRLTWLSLAAAGAGAIALTLTLNIRNRPSVPSVEQLTDENEISDVGIGLLRDYPVVTHLDLLEDYDVIVHLNELPQADNPQRAAPA
jgi:predicted anti-sigma-YlaC factor YlaD